MSDPLGMQASELVIHAKEAAEHLMQSGHLLGKNKMDEISGRAITKLTHSLKDIPDPKSANLAINLLLKGLEKSGTKATITQDELLEELVKLEINPASPESLTEILKTADQALLKMSETLIGIIKPPTKQKEIQS